MTMMAKSITRSVEHLKHFFDTMFIFEITIAIARMIRQAIKHGFITTVHKSMNASHGLLIIQLIGIDLVYSYLSKIVNYPGIHE